MDSVLSKILIVDDNAFYLALLKTILKDVKADIYMASSGKEALSIIREHDFALSILDIQMPEMDGFVLAGHIRNMQDRDLVPIIFLTADFSDEIELYKGYSHGAIDFLTKPVNKTIFLNKVRIFLELDRQKRTLLSSYDSLQRTKLELVQKQHELEAQNKALQTAQKETEQSRKNYIKLYDFAPSGYFTINREGRIFEINLKGARLFGSEPTQLINRNFREFVDSEMLSELDSFLAHVFESKSNSGCEIKLKEVKGRIVYVYLESGLIDEKQKCLLSMVDLTDQKEVQIALKESEELYHSLLKTSPDGILITDLKGKITEASDIAIELLGNKNKSEIEGMPFIQFVPKQSRRTFIKIYRATLHEGMVQNLEIELNRIDQTVFAGEVSLSQIKGNNGELKAFMAVFRDISERKLFEKQMRQSERMAGIGELATGMAHEINQPLNTISLSIDNVLFSISNNTISETYLKSKLNKVFDNITRIKKIIDHVRTFSRDQNDFTQSTFEINNCIVNSISMISEHFMNEKINLTFHPGKNIPITIGNAYRFEQVILNLLINAKDAVHEMQKKKCKNFKNRIHLSTKLINNQVIIEVTDNGIGINEEDIDKVLFPFFTTKAPGKGTGLGLSISYGIIKELNGEIEIQSKPQIGTSILIKIPV
ncbi:MAG TPA: PAS domain S-box protein [Prolixibacteraceae bacterium]|nr:PAS domain S-box protein [Prolixibacteraceae bacterium]